MFYLIVNAMMINKQGEITPCLILFKQFSKQDEAVEFMKAMGEFKNISIDSDPLDGLIKEGVDGHWVTNPSKGHNKAIYQFNIVKLNKDA